MLAACAACAEKQQEPEEEQQIAGADWRTWGWVNDTESMMKRRRSMPRPAIVFPLYHILIVLGVVVFI